MPRYKGTPTFFYRRWSAEEPTSVVLLLHGFGENTGLFHRLAAELTRAGSEVWAPDHVGHGLSGEHDGLFESIDQLAVNAKALLEEIRAAHPDLPIFVVGHSLGGLTGLAVAAEAADLHGVVLTGPPVVGQPAVMPEKPVFSRDRSYIDDARNDPLGITSPQAEANLWRAVAEFLPAMPGLVGKVAVPTLVVFGENDVFTSPDEAQAFAQSFARGRLWVVPEGHHDILQDVMHRRVAGEICNFIDEQRRRNEVESAHVNVV